MPNLAAIIVAAGRSSRFQRDQGSGEVPGSAAGSLGDSRVAKKPFVTLGELAVWQHCAKPFREHPAVEELLLVVAEEDLEWVRASYRSFIRELRIRVVIGGQERVDSVAQALHRLDSSAEYVAIHDGARPWINFALIERVFAQAQATGAAIPAIPVHSTVKQSDDGRHILQTLDRSRLYLAQTPQIFRRDWILTGFAQRAGRHFTDEAQMLEQAGFPVALVEGSTLNMKITLPEDLWLAEFIRKQGLG